MKKIKEKVRRIITVNHIIDWDMVQVTEASRHERWLIEAVEIRKREPRPSSVIAGTRQGGVAGKRV